MEDDYADIYYVDPRNAVVRDHRPGGARGPLPWMPGRRPLPPSQTVYVPPVARHQPQPAYNQQPVFSQQPQVIYTAPPPMYPAGYPTTAATLFGKLTTGQIVEMVSQIFAALQSLPNAPVATREVSTDVSNLILYQGALAQHAKRDEQVRTLGGLVAKLVG
jgi:hypothetical protein